MAFSVKTFDSADALQEEIGGTVTVYDGEDALAAGLDAAADVLTVVATGGYFVLIDAPTVANLSLRIVAKGAFLTRILETA